MEQKCPCWHNPAPYGKTNTWGDSKKTLKLHEYLTTSLWWTNDLNYVVFSMLQCKHVSTLQPSEVETCPEEDYPNSRGICCNKCFAGTVWPPAHHTWFTCSLYITQADIRYSTVKSILQSLNCVLMWFLCFPGTKFVKECDSPGHRTTCEVCPNGEYTDQMNFSKNCRKCRTCKGRVTLSVFCITFLSLWWFASSLSFFTLLFCSIEEWRNGIAMWKEQEHYLSL